MIEEAKKLTDQANNLCQEVSVMRNQLSGVEQVQGEATRLQDAQNTNT